MKIVDVTEFYSERGGGVRSHLTVRGHFLCQLGHDHVVIAPGAQDGETLLSSSRSPLAGTARIVRVAGPPLPYDSTYHLLGRIDAVRRRVRSEHADVLEAHSPYLAAAAIVASGRGASTVRTAFWHSDHVGTYVEPALATCLGRAAASRVARPLWAGVRAMLAPFDAIFVAGRRQADRLEAAGVNGVVRAPFGVDACTFHPGVRSDEERNVWLAGAAPDAALLVGVGRFAVEKRWDVVLDAFAQVCAGRPTVLVLFGDGPERKRLERMAPPGVRFAGFERDRSRLASALASADILVHGCPYETFGLSIAEGVACGTPVVVPDAGGAADAVDRTCGRTYRSLDSKACAEAITSLLDGDRASLRERSLEAARRVPTAREHFAKVMATYDDLLRTRPPQGIRTHAS